jgi:hypothetical protein
MPNFLRRAFGLLAASTLAALATVAPAGAAVVQNATVELTSLRSEDCTGDVVQFDGRLHLVALDLGGGRLGGHLNYEQVTATALGDGTVYRAASADNFTVDLGSAPAETSSSRTFLLVGSGPGDNLIVHVVTHVTANAAGEVTAEVDRFEMECR